MTEGEGGVASRRVAYIFVFCRAQLTRGGVVAFLLSFFPIVGRHHRKVPLLSLRTRSTQQREFLPRLVALSHSDFSQVAGKGRKRERERASSSEPRAMPVTDGLPFFLDRRQFRTQRRRRKEGHVREENGTQRQQQQAQLCQYQMEPNREGGRGNKKSRSECPSWMDSVVLPTVTVLVVF